VVNVELVKGATVEVTGGGQGRRVGGQSQVHHVDSSDSVVEWVLRQCPPWCGLVPAGNVGIGIGGTAEKAMLLAKESLMDPIDIQDLIARGPQNRAEELRLELYEKVNRLGIGAQGLGGLTTVLDVKVRDYPATQPTCRWP